MEKLSRCLKPLILCTLGFMVACSSAPNVDYIKTVPREERKGLAVFNFVNTSPAAIAEQYQPWALGIPAMLMTDLESIGLFNIVSRERFSDIVKEQQLQASGLVDPETAVQMGKLIAAHYILTGSFSVMEDRMRIETNVYSVESGVQLGAASVEGTTTKFFLLEKHLVIKVTSYLEAMLSDDDVSRLSSNVGTRSIQASLNNYAGEIWLLEAKNLKNKGRTKQADSARESAK
ncbi:MAG: CsgG/HfaB family protein, partial [Desulfobacteraceae bacterium]